MIAVVVLVIGLSGTLETCPTLSASGWARKNGYGLPMSAGEAVSRFDNDVFGVKLGFHPGGKLDFRAAAYFSSAESQPIAVFDFTVASMRGCIPGGG